jgi:hypothetical protein
MAWTFRESCILVIGRNFNGEGKIERWRETEREGERGREGEREREREKVINFLQKTLPFEPGI